MKIDSEKVMEEKFFAKKKKEDYTFCFPNLFYRVKIMTQYGKNHHSQGVHSPQLSYRRVRNNANTALKQLILIVLLALKQLTLIVSTAVNQTNQWGNGN